MFDSCVNGTQELHASHVGVFCGRDFARKRATLCMNEFFSTACQYVQEILVTRPQLKQKIYPKRLSECLDIID